jgi:alpha-N-arabinofuranosidase
MKIHSAILVSLFLTCTVQAAEVHVSKSGDNENKGSKAEPFKTISTAAESAQPGDTITVHEGVYRERINPPRGGSSDDQRIVYQAAPGERVEIKGSEVVTGWEKVQDDIWKVVLPNSFFGGFNPYSDLIHGDWFRDKGRAHHTGAVYLKGEWLIEAAKLEELLQQVKQESDPLWFAKVGKKNTSIWAQFKGVDPNSELVEVNARQSVFYPDKPGRNFITVRGFTLAQAATPWAPPTAEQIGLIGTHWSKGWIIEDNEINHSVCVGIALGKHGDEFDNTSANSAEGYVKTIERAHAYKIPWTKENIGHHIVRNNHISHCEQAGIVGSLGCSFSTITDNTIHDILVRQLFTGAEMAGIKFHGAIDTEISRTHLYRTCRGLWLDWMSQDTRVSQNLFHDNAEDLFIEVNHGPYVVDNNIFLSPKSVRDNSQGCAFLHNLFGGSFSCTPQGRITPYHKAHSTEIAGMEKTRCGDNRFFNNIFKQDVLGIYKDKLPILQSGNVYVGKGISFDAKSGVISLSREVSKILAGQDCKIVTSEMLGKAEIPDLPYEDVDGKPLRIDTDYFGKSRNEDNPMPGPFELPAGQRQLKVWPIKGKQK